MVVKFHLSYIPKQITLYQILRLLKRIWEKLYKILIQIKLMIICAKSIIMTLQIVYKLCLKKDYFPDNWKKANVVPVHKKMPSIYYGLSVCGKVQERLNYNSVF